MSKGMEQYSVVSKLHWILLSSILLFCTVSFVKGQNLVANLSTPITINTTNSSNNETFQVTNTNISLCTDGDKLSAQYCKCMEKVTSCDFASFPGSMENRTALRILVDEMKHPAKRLCICGGPRHVLFNLTRKTPGTTHNNLVSLHRVDIYNITGPLHITEAFQSPFAGDFYALNVSHLYSLRAEVFNRGNDLKIEDVQDLECCSKIKVPQHHAKPTLHIESVRIGEIYSRSLSSFHIWRTIILKNLTVRHIHQRGIALESTTEHVNLSISYCTFDNVSRKGIVVEDFHNAFISKNTFGSSSAPDALEVISKIENSSLVVVDNVFHNALVLDMTAHRVLNWFNFYFLWDNWTFAFYPEQPFFDSVYSIEYNTVQYFMIKHTDHDPMSPANSSMLTHDNVTFYENVLGSCNCSTVHGTFLPDRISMHQSRCDSLPFVQSPTKPNPNENCLVDFKAVMSTCTDESKELDPSLLCKNHGIKKPSFSQDKMIKLSFKATGFKIISPFISEMMKDLKFRFFIHNVFLHSEEDEEKQYSQYRDDEDGDNQIPSHPGLVAFFVLLSIAIFTGGVFILIKQRVLRKILNGGSNLIVSESYDVLTTST